MTRRAISIGMALAMWMMAVTLSARGQQAPPSARSTEAPSPQTDGIAVSDPTVQKACGPCHTVDDKQQISRISFQRTTPEGWERVIRRMVALNGLRIEPDTARVVLRYLANHLGLAPEEARPAAFEAERRLVDYRYEANEDAEKVCTACHSMGRVISQRRTREEWQLLAAMHRGYYPLVDFQGFRRLGPAPREGPPDGRPPDTRHPIEKAIDHLARAFPLHTAEWAAWRATMRPPRLEGRWSVRGHEIGRGAVYGEMVITASSEPDEFTTRTSLVYARTGERVTRTGEAIVYTGFQWRGRSIAQEGSHESLREVLFVDRDWRTMDGRWFTGSHDEIGLDVTLERLGEQTRVLGTDMTALRAGSSATVRLFGVNFPPVLQPSDLDLGPGITVAAIENVTREQALLRVEVAPDAPVGARDLFLRGSRAQTLAVYDSVDRLEVLPEWSMARVGGIVAPKALAQFEARAYDNGPDNKPDTDDDVDLGVVWATWTLEEFAATYDDDDVRFVGTIDRETGLFTPNVDGPNPQRRGHRNNVGDVYVVATYTPEAAGGQASRPLRARAHLLVTVPLYMRWEPLEPPR